MKQNIPSGRFYSFVLMCVFCCFVSLASAQDSLNIQLVPKFYSSGYNMSCYGISDGFINSQVSGGTQPYSYTWSNGTHDVKISDLPAGVYSVSVTDASNPALTSIQSITLYEPSELAPQLSISQYGPFQVSRFGASDGEVILSCFGGSGAYQVLWSTGSTERELSALSAGTYSYSISDESGCMKQGSITIAEPPVLNSVVTILSHSECGGEIPASAVVHITGGAPPYLIKWENGNSRDTATHLDQGEQNVYVIDACGGEIQTTFEIQHFAKPKINIQNSSFANGYEVSCYNCYNGQAEAIITNPQYGPYTYLWKTGESTPTLSGLGAGIFSVSVTDVRNCSNTANVTLTAPERDDWTMGGNTGTNPETQFIGTSNETDVVFKTNNTEAIRLAANQNIGIGTTTPTAKVDVAGDVRVRSNLKVDSLASLPDSIGATYRMLMVDNDGNIKRGPISGLELDHIPETVISGECPEVKVSSEASWLNPRTAATNGADKDLVFTYAQVGIKTHCPNTDLDVRGTTYSDKLQVGAFEAQSDADVALTGNVSIVLASSNLLSVDHSGTNGAAIKVKAEDFGMFIDVTASQSKAFVIRGPVTEPRDILGFAPSAGVDDLAENFVINGNGHVSIGTNDMKTSLLAVGGEVACRGVRILDPALNMPDYVFSPNYVLPRLDSVQTFIDQNCHLPGVESAQMIMENGLDMAKMQAAQLEQIERLYLYILSLEKKLKELDKKLDEIEKNDEK